MIKIDEILYLLDSNRTLEEQSIGIELSKNLKYIGLLVKNSSKNTWENCAKILSTKKDYELKLLFSDMLHWLKEEYCPAMILERIKKIKDDSLYYMCKVSIREAVLEKNKLWLKRLKSIEKSCIDYRNKSKKYLLLLDDKNAMEKQRKGIILCEKIDPVFLIQPDFISNKGVWKNCAKILATKLDEELDEIIEILLLWIKEEECPYEIIDRLKKFKTLSHLDIDLLNSIIDDAKREHNCLWLERLLEIKNCIEKNVDKYNNHDFYVDIDYILFLLSWNRTKEQQKKGVELSKNVKNLKCFILPYYTLNNEILSKDIWENCAKVLAEKNDEDLEPYLYDLLEWIQDLNWPGAEIILERLNNFKKNQNFIKIVNKRKREAKMMRDEVFLEVLDYIKF